MKTLASLASGVAHLYYRAYQLRGIEFANGFDQFRRVFISGIVSKVGTPRLMPPRSLNDIVRKQMLTLPAEKMVGLADKARAFEYVTCDLLSPRQRVSAHESIELLDIIPEEPFVAKVSNDSGSVTFFPDGCQSDHEKERLAILFSSLGTEYGSKCGEDWYSMIPPKVVIEPMICDLRVAKPTDFKLHFFRGEFWFLQRIRGRFGDSLKETLFDKNLSKLEFKLDHRMQIDSGNNLDKGLVSSMIKCGETLIADFDYARVDFLESNGEVFFGEVTFAPMSGLYLGSGHRRLIKHLP